MEAAGEGGSGIGAAPWCEGLGDVGSNNLKGVTPLGIGRTGGGTTKVSSIMSFSGTVEVDLASPAGSR